MKLETIENKILELQTELIAAKQEGEKKLKAIENGVTFGFYDGQDMFGGYFPCELLKVIDRKRFIIKVREISINRVSVVDVFGLCVFDS